MEDRIIITGNTPADIVIHSLKVASEFYIPITDSKNISPTNTFVGNKIIKEQVPETFEELKEMCKDIKGVDYAGGNAKGEMIIFDKIWFAENGEIWGYNDNYDDICHIGKSKTPSQMWQMIKILKDIK